MRTLFFLLVAGFVAVVIGSGTGSGAEGARVAAPPTSGYEVKATFSGKLLVSWGFTLSEEGRHGCDAWAKGGGISKFHADSIRPVGGYLQHSEGSGIPGVPRLDAWARLALLGKARGKVERSITMHASGVNWYPAVSGCTGTRPRRPSSIDCGERPLRTLRATLYAVNGDFTRTLDPHDELGTLNAKDLIRFTIFAGREPFSSCDIPKYAQKPHYAPTFILDRSLRVKNQDQFALRHLRQGRSHSLTDHYGGACTDGVPARDCAFVLDLRVTITRV